MAPYVGRPWFSASSPAIGRSSSSSSPEPFAAISAPMSATASSSSIRSWCSPAPLILAVSPAPRRPPRHARPAIAAPLVALVAFVLLMRFGGYFYLDFALADWAFAADLARRRHCRARRGPRTLHRGCDPCARIIDRRRRGAPVLGESRRGHDGRGDRALLRATPAYRRRMPARCFLTVGSSIMKIGLHPAADGLRRLVRAGGGEKPLLGRVPGQGRPDQFLQVRPG